MPVYSVRCKATSSMNFDRENWPAIIHMNGRIYAPQLGRMLSPDPVTQAPDNGQNYNRYSYVFNNPMRYTDPSGFKVEKDVKCIDNCTSSAAAGSSGIEVVNVVAQDLSGGNGIVGNTAALAFSSGGTASPSYSVGDRTGSSGENLNEIEPVDEDNEEDIATAGAINCIEQPEKCTRAIGDGNTGGLENIFKDVLHCAQQCVQVTYGPYYDLAESSVIPTVSVVLLNEAAEELQERLAREARDNLNSVHFRAGTRQWRTLMQFRVFLRVAGPVTTAFTAGFVSGAWGYCGVQCATE